jgi:dTDP-4-dehydrorhamnose reductase
VSGPLLVTGGAGYLGRRVLALAAADWAQAVGTCHRTPLADGAALALELSDPQAVEAALTQLRPQAIIHTAAVTPALGSAMTDQALWQVNVLGTAALAQWAARTNTRLVHVSSDAIWGGRDAAYTEADVPAPITAYGASKAAAEALVQALHPQAAIARTSLIYGWQPPDPNTVMALQMLHGQRGGCLFTDEIRCPIFVDDLAHALLELAQLDLAGVFHLVGSQALSRYDFGAALVRWHAGDPDGLPAGSASASGVRRPSQVIVTNGRTQMLLHSRLRGVDAVMAEEVVHGTNTGGYR